MLKFLYILFKILVVCMKNLPLFSTNWRTSRTCFFKISLNFSYFFEISRNFSHYLFKTPQVFQTIEKLFLLHDNAGLHSTKRMAELLKSFKWTVSTNPMFTRPRTQRLSYFSSFEEAFWRKEIRNRCPSVSCCRSVFPFSTCRVLSSWDRQIGFPLN